MPITAVSPDVANTMGTSQYSIDKGQNEILIPKRHYQKWFRMN